jgi:hypothetical protein
MDLKESHFRYNALLKQEQGIKFDGLELFPGLDEISFGSRSFTNYTECVKSCKGMISDIVEDINRLAGEPKFKLGAEVNPVHGNAPSISKNWEEGEVARFWIYDKTMEGTGQIGAVCKSSIFAIPKVQGPLLN